MKYEYFLSEGMVRGVLVGNRLMGMWLDGVVFSRLD